MTGSKIRDRSLIVVIFLVVLAAILIGCGGSGGGSNATTATNTTGSGSNTTGGLSGSSMVFSLVWPTSTRSIPGYANCVVFTIQKGSATPLSQTLNRETNIAYTQTVTFPSLDPGLYTVTGTAYLNDNAQGPVVATFAATLQVAANTQINAPIAFTSTVASVVIDAVPFYMQTGVTTQLGGHAVDNQGNILLLPTGSLQWSITQGNDLVDLTPVGFLSALAPGTVTVQLEDITSGATATSDITITGTALTTGQTTGTTTATTDGSSTTTTTTDTGTSDTGTTGSSTSTTGTSSTGSTGTTGTTGSGSGSGTGSGSTNGIS